MDDPNPSSSMRITSDGLLLTLIFESMETALGYMNIGDYRNGTVFLQKSWNIVRIELLKSESKNSEFISQMDRLMHSCMICLRPLPIKNAVMLERNEMMKKSQLNELCYTIHGKLIEGLDRIGLFFGKSQRKVMQFSAADPEV